MTDQKPQPPAPSLAWLDDDPDPPPPRSWRRPVVLAAAVVPWLVIAAMLLRPAPTTSDAPQATPGLTPSPTSDTSTPPAAPAHATAEPTPGAGTLSSAGRLTPGPGDAGALAVVAARAWLTDVGPRLDEGLAPLGEAEATYLEHVTVEAVDWPAPGAAVVSLLAVTLDVEDGAYRDARVRRLAVPVRLDAQGAAIAGDPWWLPAPDLSTDTLRATEAVDDTDLLAAAAEALETAGVEGELTGLQRTAGWPWLASVDAEGGSQLVWLRPHLGGFVVAGSLPDEREPGGPRPTAPASPRPGAGAAPTADGADERATP